MKLVLDEIYDDGIESLLTAILEVLLLFFPRETRNDGPRRVTLDQNRRAVLFHEMPVIRADAKRVRACSENG
jgi:hypothetical protein